MTAKAIYRCSKCGAEYRPLNAGARHFQCCGMTLERVALDWRSQLFDFIESVLDALLGEPTSTQNLQEDRARPASVASQENLGNARGAASTSRVIEIIPPREHQVDAAGAERMFRSAGTEQPVSYEIAGEPDRVQFILRGPDPAASRAQQQVQATYDQARFRRLQPSEDPARADGTPCATAKLSLRKPCYLPLLMFRDGDFLAADPLRGLLGLFSHLQEGDRLLAQLILTPAPRAWADRYAGYLRPSTAQGSGEPLTIAVYLRQFVSLIVFMIALALSIWTLLAWMQRHWLEFLIAAPLASVAILAIWYLLMLTLEQSNVNPELVQLKIKSAAYDVSLRLTAWAPSPERAHELVHQLALAYRQYDLASSNALIAQRAVFHPQVLEVERPSLWDEFRGSATRLNVAELAGLWHLPIDKDVPLVERTLAKRLLPLPQTVREGMLVGHSEHQGRIVPVHLSSDAIWRHAFMVAKTQRGKSTLMGQFAVEAMQPDHQTAVVVIDPHGDLVRSLLPLVPREHVSDVVYIDFSEKQQVIGLNLLDMRQGRDADQIVSNIVHVGELVWSDYWGPRMEDALRYAVRTLLTVNEKLVQRGERQFTLLDIPPLFELENFRHRLLDEFVKDDDELLEWWRAYYEHLYDSLQIDVINPVLTKIHRFSTHAVVRAVVGQSNSTINFREILDQRKILLVNTATGIIGPDAGGLLGAIIADFVNFAVRAQMAIPNPQARARVVIVMDEFQSMIGVDCPGLLAELQKMGASFILATQAVGQLKALSQKLHASVFANIGSLFVFQSSAEDAEFLCDELGGAVAPYDVIDLDDYACYLKTEREHKRLPVMHLQTLPLAPGLPETTERILRSMASYVRPMSVAFAERSDFRKQWYGREIELLRQTNAKRQRENKRKEKVGDSRATQGGNPTPKSNDRPTQDEPHANDAPETRTPREYQDSNPKPQGDNLVDEEEHADENNHKPGQPPTANP